MNALRTRKIQCTPLTPKLSFYSRQTEKKKIEGNGNGEAEDMGILKFSVPRGRLHKAIELKVKEALQEEPGADLGLVMNGRGDNKPDARE